MPERTRTIRKEICLNEQELNLIHRKMKQLGARNFGADREHYLKSLMCPDLLILDDLGAERNTTYGKERVFDVINNRWLSRKPMIITTNISLPAMQKTADLEDRRIYDRILEVCAPIAFTGESFRKSNAAENLKKAAQYLNGSTI